MPSMREEARTALDELMAVGRSIEQIYLVRKMRVSPFTPLNALFHFFWTTKNPM